MLCEKCKCEMKKIIENSTLTWLCQNCNESIVTTYIEKINKDSTIYQLFIYESENTNIEKIKFISKLLSVNYLESEKILKMPFSCILKERATKIKEVIENLNNLGINYQVKPEFTY